MVEENDITLESYLFLKYLGNSQFILKVAKGVGNKLGYARSFPIPRVEWYTMDIVDVLIPTTRDGVILHTEPLVTVNSINFLNILV